MHSLSMSLSPATGSALALRLPSALSLSLLIWTLGCAASDKARPPTEGDGIQVEHVASKVHEG